MVDVSAKTNRILRSEMLLWVVFRTGVQLPPAPPNKVADFDRKSTTFFLCKNPLLSRDFEPSPYKATRPGVFSRTGFSCLRRSQQTAVKVQVCFVGISFAFRVKVCFMGYSFALSVFMYCK